MTANLVYTPLKVRASRASRDRVDDLICAARIAYKELEFIAEGDTNPVTLRATLRQLRTELDKWR